MFPDIIWLVCTYGLCFGFQNKLAFLYSDVYKESGDPETFLDALLHCTYCTGFHCGWMTYLVYLLVGDVGDTAWWHQVILGVVWSFASAAFCYVVDAGVKWLEESG